MSLVGKQPIQIPEGVSVAIEDGTIKIKGPNGELKRRINRGIDVSVDGDKVVVQRQSDSRAHRALHGLNRSLIQNMVTGVVQEFKKRLKIVGVGFSASTHGERLVLKLGFSHDIVLEVPEGIIASVPNPDEVVVSGIDKQLVGQYAASIRALRPPEPYKGKGIRYEGEHVRRKAGKTAATGIPT